MRRPAQTWRSLTAALRGGTRRHGAERLPPAVLRWRVCGVERLERRVLLASGPLTGRVFQDANYNGVDDVEPALAGWTVELVPDGNTGVLLQTLQGPAPAAADRQGGSVAALGTSVLVGAAYDDTGATDAGVVHLVDRATGAVVRTFANPTPDDSDRFGITVAALGTDALIGAPQDDTAKADAGAVYRFDGATGALVRTFFSPAAAAGDRFGRAVAEAGGGHVLAGAFLADTGATDAGAAYLLDSATGALLQTFVSPTAAAGAKFGRSVAALGNNVLIGAPMDEVGGVKAGAAYLFDAATGTLLQTFANPTPSLGDRFGISVDGFSTRALVGAHLDDTGAANAGAAYALEAIYTTLSDAGGDYSFAQFPAGTYTVREVLQTGYFQTGPGGGGTYTVTLADGAGSTGHDFGNVLNTPPTAVDDPAYAVGEDGSLSIAAAGVLTNDVPVDPDPITAVLNTTTASGVLGLNADGSFTYMPGLNFNGSDSFTYRAFDGTGDSNLATVTITVAPVNDAPAAGNDSYTTEKETQLVVPAAGVLINDSDVESTPLSAVLVSNPANGTLALLADGSFQYTPNQGFTGPDTFTYRASDGAVNSGLATVTINVLTRPTLSIDDVSVAEGDSGTTNLIFTVILSRAISDPVTVDYTTANNTAVATLDYVQVSSSLYFAPLSLNQTVTIPVVGDTLSEGPPRRNVLREPVEPQ